LQQHFNFLGFAERVRHGLERVQASEEEEGPQRAQAAVVGLLPLLTGKRKTTDHLFKFIQQFLLHLSNLRKFRV
jgi:hypothetical protein